MEEKQFLSVIIERLEHLKSNLNSVNKTALLTIDSILFEKTFSDFKKEHFEQIKRIVEHVTINPEIDIYRIDLILGLLRVWSKETYVKKIDFLNPRTEIK